MCHSCQGASPFLCCHCLFFNIWARATCRMRNARQLPGRMILAASAPSAPTTAAPCHSVACCAQTESGKYLISVRHLPGNDNALDVCICSTVVWLLVVSCCLVVAWLAAGWLAKRPMFGLWQTPANMPHTVCPSALLLLCVIVLRPLLPLCRPTTHFLQFNFWQTHFIINSVIFPLAAHFYFLDQFYPREQMKFSSEKLICILETRTDMQKSKLPRALTT